MMMKLAKKEVYVLVALLLVAVSPLLLQRGEVVSAADADVRLVVMSPHNETIQREFSEAFAEYWKEKTGELVYIDWRTPGGSSEVRMVLEGDFKRADERGDVGIGMDVVFGGGDYLYKKMAKAGRLEKLQVFETRKEWFTGKLGIRGTFTGEDCYGKDQCWVGVCLSEFGICFNTDGLKRIGVAAPRTWDDLGDPRYFGHIALADPMKSGSVARAFEMLIQQKIHDQLAVLRRNAGETRSQAKARAISIGWANGLKLIQRISANARYFTDSASKIPHDVAQGDAVAGMCVDFYGRTYNEKFKKADGSSRLQWIAPAGGTSTSVDPVAVLRGAPHPELAQAFVEFLLSERGQMVWNGKVGSPMGAKHHALRRLPVRPAIYTAENLQHFTDPDELPYQRKGNLIYDPAITGELFEALRTEIRVMCIDIHDELKGSWGTLIEHSNDGVISPHALRTFNDVAEFSYTKTYELKRMLESRRATKGAQSKRVLWIADKLIERSAIFRRSYADAEKLARKPQQKGGSNE